MPKTAKIIQSLNAGELSPLLDARSDTAKYQAGCRTLENYIPLLYGGVEKRPGLEYIYDQKHHASVGRNKAFEHSVDDVYMLVFEENVIRVFRNGGVVMDGIAPYEIETPYLAADLFSLKFEQKADVMYITHPDYEERKLSRTGHTSWTLEVLAFDNGPFLDTNTTTTATITASATTGTVTLTATGCTPFVTGDTAGHEPSGALATHKSQTGALFKLIHSLETMKVDNTFTATGQTSSSLLVYKGIKWDYVTNDTWDGTITLQRSYDNSVWEDVHSTTSKSNNNDQVTMTEEANDAYYRMVSSGTWKGQAECTFSVRDHSHIGVVQITTVTSTTVAIGTVVQTLASTEATTRWAEGAWSNYRGWPIAVAVSPENRLNFGGSTWYPLNYWGSTIGDYTDMKTGVLDDDAISFSLVGTGQQNTIRWMVPKEGMVLGTLGGEHIITSSNKDEPLSPTNVSARLQTSKGGEDIQALLVDQSVLFVQRGGKKVREMRYDFASDTNKAEDLTKYSNHITGTGITCMAYQRAPDPLLWCVLANGDMAVMTYEDEGESRFYSWAKITTEGSFESVDVIYGGPRAEDEVWVTTARSINGTTRRFVERFKPRNWGSDQKDCFFVDCGLTYDDTPATIITGATHLAREEVAILADGGAVANQTVSAIGRITLADGASVVHLGLPYTATVQPMKLDLQALGYTVTKRITRGWLNFYQTIGAQWGMTTDGFDDVPFRVATDNMGEYVPLYTGAKEVTFPGGYDREGNVVVRSNQPLPCTLLSLSLEMGSHND